VKLSEILEETARESQRIIDEVSRGDTSPAVFALDPVWLLKLADAAQELEQRVWRLEHPQ